MAAKKPAPEATEEGTTPEVAPEYGDTRPVMVNGRQLDPTPEESKPEPTIEEEIARAFPNERQINALLRILNSR